MNTDICLSQEIIFVDCFDTIIFREKKSSEIFKAWAQDLNYRFNIPANEIFKLYKKINTQLSIKKLFKEGVLIESFESVIKHLFLKLHKKYSAIDEEDFCSSAIKIYIEKEASVHFIKPAFINFLKKQKANGKKLCVVSDFYCSSDIISVWLKKLGLDGLFTHVFSSCDCNKEKATGKLYKLLLKQLEVEPENIIMLGDNLWSDIFMARQNKLKAENIKGEF